MIPVTGSRLAYSWVAKESSDPSKYGTSVFP